MIKYLHRVFTALSVLLNVLLGGGNNQTFSARNWHWKKHNKPHMVWLIDRVLGDGHCLECWVYWKVRKEWK
jgi:hypothetical protein